MPQQYRSRSVEDLLLNARADLVLCEIGAHPGVLSVSAGGLQNIDSIVKVCSISFDGLVVVRC